MQPDSPSSPDTDAPLEMPAPRLARVMLIDDDPDCRLLAKDALDELGVECDIIEAGSAEEALATLGVSEGNEPATPDLIFLDVEMPGMNGLDLLERLRQVPALANVPVVMVTGVADDAHMRTAAARGANSYNVKPHDAATFLDLIGQSVDYWLNVHCRPRRSA